MSAVARLRAAVAVGVVVVAWSWWHGPFNGANVLVIGLLLTCAALLWRVERRGSRCPHCRGELPQSWIDGHAHRGDGI